MRIISGSLKGRRINPPGNLPVRPTTDIAKEALFSLLYSRIDFEERNVLDLFAGTGNISFEFASRSAARVTAVDINDKCIHFINETSKQLQLENIRCIQADALKFLGKDTGVYDIIFADPPYDFDRFDKIPALVFENNLLESDGYLIVEHSSETSYAENENLIDRRKYGRVNFSIFQQKEGE